MVRKIVLSAMVFIVVALKISAQTAFEFIENKGQWDKSIQFRGQLFSAEFYIQKKGFLVALHNPEELANSMDAHGKPSVSQKNGKTISYKEDLSGRVTDRSISTPSKSKVHSHAYSVEFVGANENVQGIPDRVQKAFNNYFIGNDPARWASHVRIAGAVLYKNIYPDIDVRYYSENDQLKYDLIIHPGGDPSKIVLKYTGADKLSVRNNELIVKTSVGEVKELYPYSFQSDISKGRKEISCKYQVTGNTVQFKLGEYSKNAVLVIDPSLIFASFTGSSANQYGYTATPGPDGSLFSGGIVFEQGFPVTTGAYDAVYSGGTGNTPVDIGIMKFSPNGSQRIYATYIGGSGNDFPHSLISDPQGNLVIMGRTTSLSSGTNSANDYPGTVVKSGAAGTDRDGSIVVTKLNGDGSALIGSLLIGGSGIDGLNIRDLQQTLDHKNNSLIRNYGDDSRSEVILDGGDNIYVAAQTQSTDFPIIGGFQSSSGGQQDGVVLKINSTCTALTWSSYLGGAGDDGAFVLDISPLTGDVYVGGGTTSNGSFPGNKSGVRGPAYGGGETDGFVAQISNNGALIRSSYMGTAGADIIYGLKFDRKGFPYIMGVSRGGTWPVENAVYSVGGSSQFVAKLQPDLSRFVYSTVFGSGSSQPNMSPVAFLVDRCENVYISGWGGWIGEGKDIYDQVGVAGMPISADAIKKTTDNKDFYFIVIKKNASELLYGSYFGQTGGKFGEHVDGGTSRYDQQGVIYQAICANCNGGAIFPTTPGVIGRVNGTGTRGCNLAAVKISFNFAGVASGPESFVDGINDSVGCAPFTVTLRDTVRNAVSYIWKFGDGTPDSATTSFELSHTYNAVGSYEVMLIAIDSTSCNVADTAYTNIRVGDVKANVVIAIEKLEPCAELNYRFDNLSTSSSLLRPFTDSSFIWDFGDSTAPVISNTGSVTHSFSNPGVYQVTLSLVDTSFCNAPLIIDTMVRVNPLVRAQFETPPVGCAPYEAAFVNTSLAGTSFEWDFGDGSPVDRTVNPSHLYPNPGQFTIRLTAYDDGTCNKVHDTTMTIVVSVKPTAEFSFTPVTALENTPNIFTNLSTGGVKYKWLFGDGDSVLKNSADTVLHQYNATGLYNACLITYNEFDCTDTACHEVTAAILPLLDVPNAFTPGKFGRNSVVMVQGFGIGRMSWKIYNRFGQKVFETSDRRGGWDGTFKGQLLPVDVYGYTLDVEFTDGQKTRKTGDITLIR